MLSGDGAMPGTSIWKRLLTAGISVPVFVWLVREAPAWMFALLVIVLSTAATWELARMFERSGHRTHRALSVATGAAVTASFLLERGPVVVPMVVLTLAVLLVLSVPVWGGSSPSPEGAMATLLGVIYVSWLLGYAVLLRYLAGGDALVLFVVGVTWVGESAAYLIGSAIGRHKLAPIVSPRKTVEGALAQLIVSVGAAPALAAWLVPDWTLAKVVAAGGLLGVVGQIGDLAESVIKRGLGVKDTGGLIPGHGGVLDRLDSLLFNVPAFFYYVAFVGGR